MHCKGFLKLWVSEHNCVQSYFVLNCLESSCNVDSFSQSIVALINCKNTISDMAEQLLNWIKTRSVKLLAIVLSLVPPRLSHSTVVYNYILVLWRVETELEIGFQNFCITLSYFKLILSKGDYLTFLWPHALA